MSPKSPYFIILGPVFVHEKKHIAALFFHCCGISAFVLIPQYHYIFVYLNKTATNKYLLHTQDVCVVTSKTLDTE